MWWVASKGSAFSEKDRGQHLHRRSLAAARDLRSVPRCQSQKSLSPCLYVLVYVYVCACTCTNTRMFNIACAYTHERNTKDTLAEGAS